MLSGNRHVGSNPTVSASVEIRRFLQTAEGKSPPLFAICVGFSFPLKAMLSGLPVLHDTANTLLVLFYLLELHYIVGKNLKNDIINKYEILSNFNRKT